MTEPIALDDAVDRIALTDQLLIALDFDGTLSETVDNPEDARALPLARSAVLDLLELADTRIAVVSGRALDSLERVSQFPSSVALVGSHGSEFRVDGLESSHELDDSQRSLLGLVYRALTEVAGEFDGVRIEQKPSGCGLHTRLCTRKDAAAAHAVALRVVGELDGENQVSSRYGKDILEFTLHTADKGTALSRLREQLGASAVVFVGDDVTDEDGFRALRQGDLSVKVGEGDTAADFRVVNPDAVALFLAQLFRARRDEVESRSSRM